MALPQLFAQPVDRALHLARARAHGGQGVGDGIVGIVVVWMPICSPGIVADTPRRSLDLVRQGSAIGVAQHQPARAVFIRRLRQAIA